jgi:hypothetical protein
MGSVHKAFCDCGFAADVTVGGTRQSFLENSGFPFFCNDCGLVSVNIAKLADDVWVTTCPQCGATSLRPRRSLESKISPSFHKGLGHYLVRTAALGLPW